MRHSVTFQMHEFEVLRLFEERGQTGSEEFIKRQLDMRLLPYLMDHDVFGERPTIIRRHTTTWQDYDQHTRHWMLVYDVEACQTMNIVVRELPPLDWVLPSGVHEWKCNWCSVINKWEATYCGELHEKAVGCGHPRKEVH